MIDGNMTMISVTKKDTGTYVCSVKNLLGEDSALAVITVIDRLNCKFYRDTSFKDCRICVQQPDAKLQSPGSPRNDLEEDKQKSSSKPRFNFKRKLVSQTGDCK